jgi:5'-nucleotidase (lipoprotein e(P4) family)
LQGQGVNGRYREPWVNWEPDQQAVLGRKKMVFNVASVKSIRGIFLIVFLGLAGCAGQARQGDTQVDALLWSTASAEYEIIARQIYFQAERQLDRLLLQPHQSALLEQGTDYEKRPLAVIVDIDETVLSNGLFHYQMLAEGRSFTEDAWSTWVNEARAKPVPGAVEYTNHAAQKGVTVFYLSNRDVSLFEPTWRNLKQTGFPLEESKHQLVMRQPYTPGAAEGRDESWDKTGRRAEIARQYRVIQVIGDGLDDFMGGTDRMTPAERREMSGRYLAYWGERWFMLPNPVYGDWENAILNASGSPLVSDPTNAKYRFIRGGESQGVW